eukprot:scaffold1062_cov98-Skeletonema_dohrnii-CCMP3373.AAC.7
MEACNAILYSTSTIWYLALRIYSTAQALYLRISHAATALEEVQVSRKKGAKLLMRVNRLTRERLSKTGGHAHFGEFLRERCPPEHLPRNVSRKAQKMFTWTRRLWVRVRAQHRKDRPKFLAVEWCFVEVLGGGLRDSVRAVDTLDMRARTITIKFIIHHSLLQLNSIPY